ncbi:MAG: aminoacyl-tRNA hydrolase [Halanaerobiales bacterium]|nr:aminoacyl-tRNA hydrolase [Halanaerobiales bacterium]
MKLIVGLGNPGKKYAKTRHNVGFMAIKELSDKFKIRNIDKDCEALIAKGNVENKKVLLAQPLTYMNNSGRAVKKLADKYNIEFDDIIVIYDDLDLPAGKLRIKEKGSSGGHKGLQSIMDNFNTNQLKRIRIGIGRPIDFEVTDYVLQKFDKEQKKEINKILSSIDKAIKEILNNDVSSAMNKFN